MRIKKSLMVKWMVGILIVLLSVVYLQFRMAKYVARMSHSSRAQAIEQETFFQYLANIFGLGGIFGGPGGQFGGPFGLGNGSNPNNIGGSNALTGPNGNPASSSTNASGNTSGKNDAGTNGVNGENAFGSKSENNDLNLSGNGSTQGSGNASQNSSGNSNYSDNSQSNSDQGSGDQSQTNAANGSGDDSQTNSDNGFGTGGSGNGNGNNNCSPGCYPGCNPGCDPQCTLPACSFSGMPINTNLNTINAIPTNPQVSQTVGKQNQDQSQLSTFLSSRQALTSPVLDQSQANKYQNYNSNNIQPVSNNQPPPDVQAKAQAHQITFH